MADMPDDFAESFAHGGMALDPRIAPIVWILQQGNVETIESCQGSEGHACPEPTVWFSGGQAEGFRALAWAMQHGLRVTSLRRVWSLIDGEPTGPQWQMTFYLEGK